MSYVPTGSVVADIGTDHGHLICQLVKDGIIKRGFACDVNPLPLERAKRTIRENCLSDSIDTVLTDGLTDLPYQVIDTVIIAGMGGDLIASILLAHPWTRDSRFRFILQPMSKPEKLRKSLFENGFTISSETIVYSVGKVYSVMCVIYTGKTLEYSDISFYLGSIPERSDFSVKLYLERMARQLEKRAEGLLRSKTPEKAEKYADIAKEIRERIRRMADK